MTFSSLKEKIDHARTLEVEPGSLNTDFSKMIDSCKNKEDLYLSFLDAFHNKTDITYQQFYDHVIGVARFYAAQGLRIGDKIATISHNHWHTVVQYFAAWYCGLVVVPVNVGEDDNRIAYILENAEVKLALVRENYIERIKGIIDENDSIADLEIVECGDELDAFKVKDNSIIVEPFTDIEREAFIVFTSGTTGNPKGVVLTQRNLLEDARTISQWHNIDGQTKMMCVLPTHHVNGTVVTLITPFFAGASTVLNQKFSAGHFFSAIEIEGVHIVSVVPTLLQYLTSHYADLESPRPESLRHIICGAGPLTVQVAQNFEQKFEVPIIHGYGLSETTCYSCFLPVEQSREKHEHWMRDFGYPSIGIPVPANEMDIQDENGKSVPEGERGEIVIRGVNVMKGYFNNQEANESAFKNGWFRSGDEGFYKRDEDGHSYFFITGRLKELIIRGGINLAPLEIDEVINRAPGVKAGIAVGFENDWYGEEVGAYVQLKEGAKEDAKAIIEYCQEHLPYSKSPKVVVFGDQLPVTSTGKYQRLKVAHLFKKWKDVQFRK